MINNEPPVNISSLNSRAGYHHLVPVQLRLEAGDDNTIVFGSMGQDGMCFIPEGWDLANGLI